MGFFGASAENTPALDELAARSITYDQAQSASPARLPALASIFTGQLPSSHGLTPESPAIEPQRPHLGRVPPGQGLLDGRHPRRPRGERRDGAQPGLPPLRRPARPEPPPALAHHPEPAQRAGVDDPKPSPRHHRGHRGPELLERARADAVLPRGAARRPDASLRRPVGADRGSRRGRCGGALHRQAAGPRRRHQAADRRHAQGHLDHRHLRSRHRPERA
ncbi:MAG: sulfatase-like hydrolase/transferase [Deltaproteobacteria bacterium]|nr:sulfatase-like hydrolase/transferase [Deltaproteobacteria bacterium]